MEEEFHEIYKNYAPDLYRFIFNLCRNEQLAKDILQDTMLKAMMSADKFNGKCSVKSWLCTIAKNLYFDHLKHFETKNVPLDIIYDVTDTENIEQKITDKKTALSIHRVLHKLEEPYREVFSLRVFAELKFKDIGDIFGKSENWASVTFYRAKQKLIQMLDEEELL